MKYFKATDEKKICGYGIDKSLADYKKHWASWIKCEEISKAEYDELIQEQKNVDL